MSPPGLIARTAGASSAVIDPRLGGALLDFSRAGEPVLRRASPEGLRTLGVRSQVCAAELILRYEADMPEDWPFAFEAE